MSYVVGCCRRRSAVLRHLRETSRARPLTLREAAMCSGMGVAAINTSLRTATNFTRRFWSGDLRHSSPELGRRMLVRPYRCS
eukprot:7314319-Prymnesium_polylepis.1